MGRFTRRTWAVLATGAMAATIGATGSAGPASAAPVPVRPLTSVTSGGYRLYSESMSAPVTSVAGGGTHRSDFDGDGIDDIATSFAPMEASKPNTAFLSGEGILVRYSRAGRTDYFIPPEASTGGQFGWMYSGDFNGDGYDDLVMTDSQEKVGGVNVGGLWVIYGSKTGLRLDTARHINQGTAGVPGKSEFADEWGATAAVGDLNGDGYADLAIGVPDESLGTVYAGAVTVLFGGAHGLTGTGAVSLSENTPGVPGTAEAGDAFGSGLAIGDVNGDGYADLAVGAAGEHTSTTDDVAGMVFVIDGSRGGLSLRHVTDVTAVHAETTQSDGATVKPVDLGNQMAIGDVNGDGYGDLVTGVPLASVGTEGNGAVLTFPGSPAGISATTRQVISAESPGVAGTTDTINNRFAWSMAVADVTGDGRADVVVGDWDYPENGVDGGAFWLIPGSTHGFTGTGSHRFSQASPGVPGAPAEPNAFSSGISVLNLNGRGGLDVVASAGEHNAADGSQPTGRWIPFYAAGGTLTPQPAVTGISLITPDIYPATIGGVFANSQRDND